MLEKCSLLPVQERKLDALNGPQRVAEEIWKRVRLCPPEGWSVEGVLSSRDQQAGESVPEIGATQTGRDTDVTFYRMCSSWVSSGLRFTRTRPS